MFKSRFQLQKERHAEKRAFLFGFRRPLAASTLRRFYMLGANKLPLRQGFGPKAQNACTAQKRRGPEGPLGGSPVNRSKLKISGLKPKGKTKGNCESSCLLFWKGQLKSIFFQRQTRLPRSGGPKPQPSEAVAVWKRGAAE